MERDDPGLLERDEPSAQEGPSSSIPPDAVTSHADVAWNFMFRAMELPRNADASSPEPRARQCARGQQLKQLFPARYCFTDPRNAVAHARAAGHCVRRRQEDGEGGCSRYRPDHLHDFVGLHDVTASENIDWWRGWRISGTHGGRAVFQKEHGSFGTPFHLRRASRFPNGAGVLLMHTAIAGSLTAGEPFSEWCGVLQMTTVMGGSMS